MEAICLTYDISPDDFTRAGEASSDVKKKLKQMGVGPKLSASGRYRHVTKAKSTWSFMPVAVKSGWKSHPEKIVLILNDVGPESDVDFCHEAATHRPRNRSPFLKARPQAWAFQYEKIHRRNEG